MHWTAIWMVPLATAGLGAVGAAVAAAALRREVSRLQRAMRPLRAPGAADRRRRAE